MMTEITTLVSNVGFPIAIALYVLIRLEKTVKNNTQIIQELNYNLKRFNNGK